MFHRKNNSTIYKICKNSEKLYRSLKLTSYYKNDINYKIM